MLNTTVPRYVPPDFHYRHEYKYICDETMLSIIQGRIAPILPIDIYAASAGQYQVRSLYFDDYENRCYYENENGTDPREKYRIRLYNGSSERISLELKQKCRGKTRKLSCPLTSDQCQKLIHGELLPYDASYHPVLQKLLYMMRTDLLEPKIIVQYTRIPYVFPLGNVRITLDKNISASSCISDFLKPQISEQPIMELGMHILEVKFDEFLPDYIHGLLQTENLQHTSFSKYYYCRKYNFL